MKSAFICDGVRTPIGRYGGALSSVRPDDMAALVIKSLLQRNPAIDAAAIDDVILGCANQAGEDNRNVARMAALLAGLPESVGGTTVNRLCGSGMDAVAIAGRTIIAGEADLLVAGGVESMSRAPFVLGKAEMPFSRAATIQDTTIGWRFINPALQKTYGVDSMPETAENVAKEYGITRPQQDQFALQSQRRAAGAIETGAFDCEIAPVSVAGRSGVTVVARDEHPRSTSMEALAGLRPIISQGGTVTAGNSSGVNDGAAALVVASEEAALNHGLNPRARIIGAATAGVAPRTMGIGPVPATLKLLARNGLTIADVDVIELNEAFAAQALAVLQELGIAADAEHVNPNGGAIALGHPLGMSGARLILAAVNELHRRQTRLALCTMCIGVGQGIALLLQRV